MCESGELDAWTKVTIMDGEVVKREVASRAGGSNCWVEVRGEFLNFVEGTLSGGRWVGRCSYGIALSWVS